MLRRTSVIMRPQVRRPVVVEYRPPLAGPQVFKPRLVWRVMAWIVVVSWLPATIGMVVSLVDDNTPTGGVVMMVAALLVVLAPWFVILRSYIEIGPEHIRYRNLLHERSIDVGEIEYCEPSYHGIVVVRSSGERVVAVAVQRTNIAKWLRHPTRSDRVCDEIRARIPRTEGAP